jgi:16S rRNA (cytosine967-C5)-methyltransferase
MKGLAARKLAVEVLVKVERQGSFANLAMNSAFAIHTLSERDRALATGLVHGVLRHRGELDAILAQFSRKPPAKMTPATRNTLRIAFFQLEHMRDMPPSAVVNTCTEIGKRTGHAGTGAYVNGVLRAYLRAREQGVMTVRDATSCELAPAAPDAPAALASRYAVSEWLVNKWLNCWGEADTRQLLEFYQREPALTLRTCQISVSPDGLQQLLQDKGMKLRPGKLVPACLIVEDRGRRRGPVDKLPGFQEGLFTVQDEPAAFASLVVDPRPGQVVIDLCAAPGGKTCHLAELMANKGRVLAVDTSHRRLSLLKDTRQRLGLTNIEIFAADATNYDPGLQADAVIVDAPCSGTGVINRRSDLRFRAEPDFAALVALQRRLLAHSAKLVLPGGVLVYSTCSLEPEENADNIAWFLSAHPDFQPDSLLPFVPPAYLSDYPDSKSDFAGGWVQLSPVRHGLSGFFLARLRRAQAAACSTSA